MQLHITARHLDLTPALSDYIQKKLERVARHFKAVIRAQVILSVEKRRHIAEMVVHANGHHDFRAVGESADLYAAVDIVGEKLHKHLARAKDKRVRGRRRAKDMPAEEVIPPLHPEEQDGEQAPVITRTRRFAPKDMTVAEAAESLRRTGNNFQVFMNDDTLSVLYVRQDKSLGLIELNT